GSVSVPQAPLLGLGRTVALEHPELRCARLDLDPALVEGEEAAVLAELLADDGGEEGALRAGLRWVGRLGHRGAESRPREKGEPAHGRPFRLTLDKPGVLDSLQLRLAQRRPPGPGEVEISVEAAGLNFVDVMKALSIYPDMQGQPPLLGGECSGR